MKKLLCLLGAVAIIGTCGSFAVAAEETTVAEEVTEAPEETVAEVETEAPEEELSSSQIKEITDAILEALKEQAGESPATLGTRLVEAFQAGDIVTGVAALLLLVLSITILTLRRSLKGKANGKDLEAAKVKINEMIAAANLNTTTVATTQTIVNEVFDIVKTQDNALKEDVHSSAQACVDIAKKLAEMLATVYSHSATISDATKQLVEQDLVEVKKIAAQLEEGKQ